MYKKVSVGDLAKKFMESYGFVALVNEGKNITIIVDNEKSVSMIVDFVMSHNEVLNQIIELNEGRKASLN